MQQFFSIILVLLFTSFSALFAQPYQEIQLSPSPDPVSVAQYGISSFIQRDHLFLGAHLDDKDENEGDVKQNAGAVYVLKRNAGGTWEQAQKLTAETRQASALFGYSLNLDGDYAVIGVRGNNPAPGYQGVANIFKHQSNGSWQQTSELLATGISTTTSVPKDLAIFGRYAIVSNHTANYQWPGGLGISGNGRAFIFERDSSSESWSEVAKVFVPDSTNGNYAGWSVEIWQDYAFLGAPFEDEDENGLNHILDAGAVHIFQRDSNGTWNFHQKLVAHDRIIHPSQFGYDLEFHDSTLMVGAWGWGNSNAAGSIYLYQLDSNAQWSLQNQLFAQDITPGDNFGISLSAGGGALIIGARGDDYAMGPEQGSVYVFHQQVFGEWTQVQKIYESQAGAGYNFGITGLAIDGPSAIAGIRGGPGGGGVYHYEVCVPRHQLLKLESCEPYDFYGTMLDSSGFYEVEVEADWDCDSLTATVQFELVEVDTSMIHVGDSLIATASGATFQWMSCRSGYTPIPGATDSVYVPTSTGFYAVEVTQFGCTEISPCLPVLIFTSKDNPLADQIRLYPNPSSGQLNLDLSNLSQAADLHIYDATGRWLGSRKQLRGLVSLDLHDYGHGPGLYVLRVQVGEEFAALRVVWE